jgi:hypothetical protein
MKAVSTSDTLIYFRKTTLSYFAESCHLHTGRRDNLKSHTAEYYTAHNIKVNKIGKIQAYSVPINMEPTTIACRNERTTRKVLNYNAEEIRREQLVWFRVTWDTL